MRYVSIDIETSGLSPEHCQLLEVAMVLEDTDSTVNGVRVFPPVDQLKTFHAYVRHERVTWEPFALALHLKMNPLVFAAQDKKLVTGGWPSAKLSGPVLVDAGGLALAMNTWLAQQDIDRERKVTVAGKNFAGFDARFLPPSVLERFFHRVLDPGSVFVNWSQDRLPSLGDLVGEVSHTALGDARDVITALRQRYT